MIAHERFEREDTHLFVGDTPIRDYLRSADLGWVVQLRDVIEQLDYSPLLTEVREHGRLPIHPRVHVGLIVYGALRGQRSLRALATLATLDVGAWLVCGGRRPDHSTIGKFVVEHAGALSDEFFLRATRLFAQRLRLAPGLAAIDGTVIESAASAIQALRVEAATEHAQTLRAQALQTPDDQALEQAVRAAEHVAEVAQQRQARRKTSSAVVAPSDPDAVLQPRKDGPVRPGYRPSIVAHESGLIVGQYTHPSSEPASIEPLLAQHQRVLGADPTTTVMDGNYLDEKTLTTFVERGADVLCGVAGQTSAAQTGLRAGLFDKSQFAYDEERDVFVCPQGRLLVFRQNAHEEGRALRVYQGTQCGDCPVRAQCTRGQKGRVLKRYAVDELKEQMRRILEHPEAKRRLRKRRTVAERPFARLKAVQGLRRFLRRGRARVAAEFALQCLAYNVGRVLAGAHGRSPGGRSPPAASAWRVALAAIAAWLACLSGTLLPLPSAGRTAEA